MGFRNTPNGGMRREGLTYAAAGVDIDAGNRMVELIKPLVKATARPGADAEIGGFGGLFDLKRAGFKDPVLVAATDGVGTKVKIAIETGRTPPSGSISSRCRSTILLCRAPNRCFSRLLRLWKAPPRVGAAWSRASPELQAGAMCADRWRDRGNARHLSGRRL